MRGLGLCVPSVVKQMLLVSVVVAALAAIGCGSSGTNNSGSSTNTAPSITQQPASATANAGANATLTAAASGSPTPTVQWQVSTNGGSSFTSISGATSATLTLTAVTEAMNGDKYEAVFTNTAGSLTSSAATLTVDFPPSITQQPASESVGAGANASFTAAASANPAATVQWQVSTNGGSSFSNISGATSATLTLTAVAQAMSGDKYEAVFTNTLGSVTTSAATLTVTAANLASCTGAPSGSESLVTGNWAGLVQGWQGSGTGSPVAMVFALDTNGAGAFVNLSSGMSGDLDEQLGANTTTSYQHLAIEQTGSSYVIGLDPTGSGYIGCMTLATTSTATPTMHFRFSLGGISGGLASKGRIIEWDDTTGTGANVGGVMLPQTSSQFSLGALASNYAFGEDGVNPDGSHYGVVGSFTLNTTTGAIAGESDIDDEGSGCIQTTTTGSITSGSISSLDGRGTSSTTAACLSVASPRVFYIVNSNEAFTLSTSAFTTVSSVGVPILSGRAIVTSHGSFGSSSFSGNFMIHGTGIGTVSSGNGCTVNSASVNCATVGIIAVTDTVSGAQTGNASGIDWSYQLGTTETPSLFGTGYGQSAVTFTIDPTWGRSTVSGTSVSQPPVFYLATPQPNTEPFLGFGTGSGASSTTLDPTAPLEFVEAGASSNLAVGSLAGFHFGGSEDNGDNTLNTNVNVTDIASSGSTTGTNYASGPGGLSSATITQTWTLTNADPTTPADTFPGILNNGPGAFGVTNGTRIIFFNTGSAYGSAGTASGRIEVFDKQ